MGRRNASGVFSGANAPSRGVAERSRPLRTAKLWHHARSFAVAMRKLSWTLLLPLLLLFVQQGELRHEYGHYGKQASSCQKAPPDVDHCLECLAYAQIGGLAKTVCPGPLLVSGLSFGIQSVFQAARPGSDLISPRSRGPPAIL
jgi:hypothetical protein